VAAGFLDDNIPAGTEIDELGVLGDTSYKGLTDFPCILGVGDAVARLDLISRLEGARASFKTLVHTTAYIAPTATIGLGNVICPLVFVGPGARLGDHVAVNVGACIGHDSVVEEGSIVSPNATICGSAHLGRGVFIGAGATVAPGVHIGRNSQIGAGSVVYRQVPPGSLAIGNPAKARVMYPAR
jgi:sugar O-acyltransferase (sialic acid O-acetyltransferase NeuD family)